MVYRRRRTIRKRTKKYSRRRSMMRAPRSNIRADSTYTEKLTYQTELYVQANAATFCCHWVRSGDSAATEQYPVGTNTGNNQYRQCATMFRSYKVTGMKLEYRPHFFSIGTSDVSMQSITVGTKMDIEGAQAVPVPLADYRAALDARQYDPMKPFKRYYHISRWSKGREINWRTTQVASVNGYGVATPDCITSFRLDTTGFANGALVGSIRVTYYVKFRERQSD